MVETGLNNGALIQHYDLVGISNGTRAVSDDWGRSHYHLKILARLAL